MSQLPFGNSAAPGPLVPARNNTALTPEPHGPAAVYQGGASDDLAVSFFRYWRILIRRKWLICAIAVASLALGALATLMTLPLYTAAVRLQIDRNVAKIVEGGNVTPVETDDFLRTQYELLKSRAIAERVASALKLGEDTDFLKPREFS